MSNQKLGICPLCGIHGPLTEHHAIWPGRKKGSRYYKHPMRDIMVILICRLCHDIIHEYYGETRYQRQA